MAEVAEVAVTGVDACARGWVAVTLRPAARSRAARPRQASDPRGLAPHGRQARHGSVQRRRGRHARRLPLAGVTGIDMPLGLLAAGWRDADVLARRALGRRGVTVFAIPPRPVWECESYAEASRLCRELTGKSFSVQAWGLRRKIAEAEALPPPRRRHTGRPPLVRGTS